ncbi:MAG: ABC transporter substrate-binding protein, partial [Conexivisphaera sp.]
YTINLVWGDDQSSPANGPTTTSQLITAYHPAAMILSPASVVAMADEPIIEQYGIPSIGISLTDLLTLNSQYTSGNPKAYMIFHYQPTGLQQGAMAAKFIEDEVKPAISPNVPLRVVYIGQDTEMGHSFFRGYNLSVYGNGWQNDQKIVDVIYYPAGTTQFQSIISRIITDKPNVIVEGTWPNEIAAFLQQAAEAPALKGVIQVGNAIDDDISTYGPAGPAANGWFTPTGYPEYSPCANATVNAKWAAFRQDLETYGHVTAASPAAAAYDAVWILAYAIHYAGSTNSTAIINALETMPPPPQLLMLTVPTSQGALFSNSLPTEFSPIIREYHTATFEPIVVEAFWNSTSQSVTSKIVWPPNLAVTSPVFTGTP